MGWSRRLCLGEDNSGCGCMGKSSSRHPRFSSNGMNGRKREGTVEIPCGRRGLRSRKLTYKARAEVAGDAAGEVGGGHSSEEGVDSKTRRSEGPLLEPGFRRRRDCVTAPKAQRTPFEKVRVLQRKLYRAAKAQPQRTFGVLYDKVCRLEVLEVAWDQVRRNRGAAGVDGETIEASEAALKQLLQRSFDKVELLIIYIDGMHFGEQCVAVVGVDV